MSLCSISTSWRAEKTDDPKALVDEMKSAGTDMLELDFRLSEDKFNAIIENRDKWGLKISSIHAVCPAPKRKKRGAETYLISDEDEEKRKRGVDEIKMTIDNAARAEASAVVIHCGRVPMEEPIYEMMRMYDAGKIGSTEWRDFLHEAMLTRTTNMKKCFQQLLKSLDEINRAALKTGIDVGLENRYYFGELPNLEEFGIIFNRFSGGRLGYWHDTGHAHVQETLFGVSQEIMLETYSDEIIGTHLHDVVKGYTDHNEPGYGVVDFDMVKNYIKPDTIRVMELNRRVSVENAKKGVAFLKEKGIFT